MRIRVQNVFHDVADLSPENRARYFTANHIEEDIRLEVEELLSFDLGPATSLAHDIGAIAEQAMARTEAPDLRCGPYRLTRLIGRGGMGTVHLAEREDGEVTQRVAVKLLRPGGDDPWLRQRFLGERQILAALSHPNIARLLDAGHREDGQPYLAMEFVDGKTIDVYTAGFSTQQKLDLFLKVCDAVSYLHRNLVVHRDLKPNNILVTSEGEPKLLDFGIARVLDLSTDSTMTGQRMLTPDYASPEQAAGGAVSTATDIYSLGAVLYQLLTGQSPHCFAGTSPGSVLAIFNAEIARPSKLEPRLKGDLDFIVLKALRREPGERYVSVDALADDIRAYSESRPVRARSGDTWYHARKFLRRYWIPVTAAVLVVSSLSGGLYVANRERRIAQRRFAEVRQLANKLFDIDALARQLPGSTRTRQLIVDTSLEYLGRLAADARGDPGLALEVGNAYLWVAQVQGIPIASNLGQLEQAGKNLLLAENFIHSVLLSQPANRKALLLAAQIGRDRMALADINGQTEESIGFARQAEAHLTRFNAQKSDRAEAGAILGTYLNLAQTYEHAELDDDALRLSRRGSELARTFGRATSTGASLQVTAKILQRQGALDEALRSIQESASLLEPRSANVDHAQEMNFVMSLVYEGEILGGDNQISLGRTVEAVAVLQRAFKIADDRAHQDPNDENTRGMVEMAGYPLAGTLRHSDARLALSVYDHILGHLAEIKSNPNVQLFEARALAGSSYPLRALGRRAEASRRLEAAFQRLLQLKMYPASELALGSGAHRALSAQADYEAETGQTSRSLQLYQELLDLTAAPKPGPQISLEDAMEQSGIYQGMAAVYRRAGNADSASALDARRLALWRHWEQKLPGNSYVLTQIGAKPSP